jgi:deoxyribose-phosphate aldolase
VTLDNILESKGAVASLIDHTLLKPEATHGEITRLCDEARELRFASVCINPHWIRIAAERLKGTSVRVCTVVGFPLGANDPRTKLTEAGFALAHGAQELDMVQNIGALRSGDFHLVHKDIADLADVAHAHGAILKVILETCLLTNEEKIQACRLAADAKADFVKTSTGFSKGGATIEDVRLMRQTVGEGVGVKASGGVRTFDALRQMVLAGANRIGTSSGITILHEMDQALATPSAGDLGGY